MKNLILILSGIVLLGTQANGQNLPLPTVSYNHSSSSHANVSLNVTANSNAHTVAKNDVKSNHSYTYSVSSNDDQVDDPMKAKTFSRSFSIDRSDKVNLSNTYGSITIKTWAKNEIKVDVDIKAYANTDTEAQELLDKASISATKNGDEVSYKTKIQEKNASWGNSNRNGKRSRRELKIHYTVYMPSTNALHVSQQYGSVVMDDFAGPTSLSVQYGNLTTGDLKNTNNNINVQYGKTNLQNVNAAKIDHQYGGGVTVASIGNIVLKAQYISVSIGNVKGNAEIRHQYGGGTTITSVGGSLDLEAQYVRVKLGSLSGNLKANVQYGGGLTIDNIDNPGKNIDVDAQYAPISLGFSASYNADFTTSVSYNSFKYGSNVSAKREGGEDRGYQTTKNYTGQIGKGGSAKVSVTCEYSSITFK